VGWRGAREVPRPRVRLSDGEPPQQGKRPVRRASFTLAAACALLGACALPACSDGASPSSAASAAASATTAPGSSSSTPKPAKPAPATTATIEGIDLLDFQLTSAIKNKDPADKLDSAKPGTRVYGHVTVRNRTSGPKRVSLSFRVNDDERSLVDLNVEKSWSWRTWAYVTLRKDDKGELTVHVFDDHGAELGKQSIPIK
jgi:hypothetical protein